MWPRSRLVDRVAKSPGVPCHHRAGLEWPDRDRAVSNIFISYRREDAAAYAGRLCDHLDTLLGEDRIFMDVEDIHPGQNFAQTIDQSIATCTALLVVMGPKWREILWARSQEHEKDYVRYEIEAALARKITTIPVLVGGATMAQLTDLPEGLAELPFHQAMELRDATFKEDCSRLANFLKETAGLGPQPATSPQSRQRRATWITGAALVTVLLALALGLTLWN
jgi:TIR domain